MSRVLCWYDDDYLSLRFNVVNVFRSEITMDEYMRGAWHHLDAERGLDDLIYRKLTPLVWLAMPCHDEPGTP